jgi:hypothetical protein
MLVTLGVDVGNSPRGCLQIEHCISDNSFDAICRHISDMRKGTEKLIFKQNV